jgi:hypothetical protein
MFVSSIARKIMSCEAKRESRLGGVFAMRAGSVVSWVVYLCLIVLTHITALLLVEPGRTAPDGLETSAGYHCMWMLLYVHGRATLPFAK